MMDRKHVRSIASLVFCAAGSLVGVHAASASDVFVNGDGQDRLLSPAYLAAKGILEEYPGLKRFESQGRTLAFFGRPMVGAAEPVAAADRWLALHDSSFGMGAKLDLRLDRVEELTNPAGARFTLMTYRQYVGGVPVEFGSAKILVLNPAAPGGEYQTVYAAAKVAEDVALKPIAWSEEQAMAVPAQYQKFAGLKAEGRPELAVFYGEGDFDAPVTPALAWKFVLSNAQGTARYTCFVDVSSGELLHARNDILHVDITGQVRGKASPGLRGDTAATPPVLTAMPEIQVRVQGTGTSVWTDRDGNFTIPWTGTAPVTLEVGVAVGRRVNVNDDRATATELLLTQSVTPGVSALLDLNNVPDEGGTSQVNAFIHQTRTRNHFRDRAPTFTQLDTVIPANVMLADTCNAFYNGVSTNFFAAGGTCNNTAISTVIAHEYGHHIVNRLGLAQGAFGEGFSDTMAMMLYDTAIMGQDFSTNGGVVRTPDTANVQYPCPGAAVHFCGQILGNVIWEMRKAMGTRYGTSLGLTNAQQLHVNWALVTGGGIGFNSAHPLTSIEMLTVDDTDGILANGTPNQPQICAAFAQGSITPPAQSDAVSFAFPDGKPAFFSETGPTSFRVNVSAADATPVAGSGQLLYRFGTTGAFTSVPMTQLAANQYRASVPAAPCGSVVQYRFTTQSSVGLIDSGANYCNGTVVSNSGEVGTLAFNQTDDFEIDRGWTVGPDTATLGNWVRVDPNATIAQPADDTTVGGTQCWVTGNAAAGAADGTADVDNGQTILTSPVYNLSAFSDAIVSYNRWYSNGAGATPYADVFTVQVSTNNGGTWFNAEILGPGSSADVNVLPGWIAKSWSFSSLGLTPSSQVRVRFIAEDAGAGSLVEAAIDDFSVRVVVCQNDTCGSLDFNNDGNIDPTDVDAYFSILGEGPCLGGPSCNSLDFNGDGNIDPTDVDAYFSILGEGPCIR
jgi:hypothetical protein